MMQVIVEGYPPGMAPQYNDNIELKGLTPEEIETMAEWLALQKRPVN